MLFMTQQAKRFMGNMKKAHNKACKLNRLDISCKSEVKTDLAYIKAWHWSKKNKVSMNIKEQTYCIYVTAREWRF